MLLSGLLLWITADAKETDYRDQLNISYYPEEIARQDAYIASQCKLDIHVPTKVKDFATLVWFHGGGLTGGDKAIPKQLKEQGICVISVNYRLHPKVKAPAYIEDAAAAVAWAFKHIGEYGGSPSRIYVSGHSAGGYLASMVGLDKKWLKVHGIDANRIAGLIPLSGQTITHFTVRKEMGIPEKQPIIDAMAPLYHVRADAPPLLLITGDREKEMLGRYEENAYLMRMMKVVGHKNTSIIELKGEGHGMVKPAIPHLLNMIRESNAAQP